MLWFFPNSTTMFIKNIFFLFICFNLSAQNIEKTHFEKYQKIKNKNEFERDSVYKIFSASKIELEKEILNENKKELVKKMDELQNHIEGTILKDLENEFEYIKKDPSFSDAPGLLLFRLKRHEGANRFDEILSMYKNLKPEIQNSEKGIELKEALSNFFNSKINSPAPLFDLYDIDKKLISLNDYKGNNYVFIDFWASWCAPCREEFPFLKEMYAKYKDKGLAIVTISRDEKIGNWKNAIVRDGIESWKHISIKENNSDIEKKYFVTAIPVRILIDKDGIIIGRWRGGGEENKTEIKKILEQIFNN